MKSWILPLSWLFLTGFTVHTIHSGVYPKNYFASPVAFDIKLSGTFGELRSNHFHAGIDIKSPTTQPGPKLLAAAEGYISRIKVKAGGYGKALYITHPKGYTTVYAHMKSFTPDVEDWVKQQQYKRNSFAVNLYPGKRQFPVAQSQFIGRMGATGHAFGPHLHFEIRDARNQEPINPLLFNLPVKDEVPPWIQGLKVYAYADQHKQVEELEVPVYKSVKHGWQVADTVFVTGSMAAVAVQAIDKMDGVHNRNGIFSIALRDENKLLYKTAFDRFAFRESRYLNAHVDYSERMRSNRFFHRCHRLPGDYLSMYDSLWRDGFIPLGPGEHRSLEITVSDFFGNETVVPLIVKRQVVNPEKDETQNQVSFMYHNRAGNVEGERFAMHFGKGSFYHDIPLPHFEIREKNEQYVSPVIQVGEAETPLHRYAEIRIQPDQLSPADREKAFIAYCNEDYVYQLGGSWEGDWIVAYTRNLGHFTVMVDSIAPQITAVHFTKNMKGWNEMRFRISDNFPVSGKARSLLYEARVDDKWILMEHDIMKNEIFHRFDGRIKPGKHTLSLRVWDDRGNERLYRSDFVR